MGKLNVKKGTAGNAHLCDRCSWGQVVTGYRESDRLAICTDTYPNLVLPFTVHECSRFADKHRPDWKQMQQLAIDIQPVRVSSRTAGFSGRTETRWVAAADEDEESEDEAAETRESAS